VKEDHHVLAGHVEAGGVVEDLVIVDHSVRPRPALGWGGGEEEGIQQRVHILPTVKKPFGS
jgi:hypothetical protein